MTRFAVTKLVTQRTAAIVNDVYYIFLNEEHEHTKHALIVKRLYLLLYLRHTHGMRGVLDTACYKYAVGGKTYPLLFQYFFYTSH